MPRSPARRVALRQAARRALQRRRPPRGAGRGGRRRRRRVDPSLPVLGLPGSVLLRVAEAAGLPTVTEAFADRGYTADGTLVPRAQPGAVLHDPAEVAARACGWSRPGQVDAADGAPIAGRRRVAVRPRRHARVPCRWPAPCGRGSRRPASTLAPSRGRRLAASCTGRAAESATRGLLVEVDDLDEVLALAPALRALAAAAGLPGRRRRVVPAARTAAAASTRAGADLAAAAAAVALAGCARVGRRPAPTPRRRRRRAPTSRSRCATTDRTSTTWPRYRPDARRGGRRPHRHAVAGGVRRLRTRLRLPRRRRPAARRRRAASDAAAARAGRIGRVWPGSSAASTRAPRPAGGSCSAHRRGALGPGRDPPALLGPGRAVRFVDAAGTT